MQPLDRLLIWTVGFLAGFAAAMITFEGGWGGRGYTPPSTPPPPSFHVPDHVPDWMRT